MFTKEDEGQHCTHDRTGEREVQCYPRHAINGPAPCYRLLYTCMGLDILINFGHGG